MAEYVGKPAAFVVGMGFATNSLVIPAIVGKGDLLLSDEQNHKSIAEGARMSGAKIKPFRCATSRISCGEVFPRVGWEKTVVCKVHICDRTHVHSRRVHGLVDPCEDPVLKKVALHNSPQESSCISMNISKSCLV